MNKLFSDRTILLAVCLLLLLSMLCFHVHGAAGDVDLSFDPGSGVNGPVYAVAVQSDGKILIGGAFSTVKGLQRFGIARLNADGSGDSSFDPGTIIGISGYVFCVKLQPDGKVLVGGSFWTVNGAARNGIARLNADGSLDNTFNPGSGANSDVDAIAVQSDDKLLIGGYFTEINGTSRKGIARLNSSGSLDGSFYPGTGADGGVAAVALQSDGKVLIGGDFATINATGRNGIARLNANGNLDASFNPGTGASGGGVWAVGQEADGKVLIGGPFTAVNGTNRSGLARLNTNGSLDSAFNPGIGATPAVASILPQSDGKMFIAGRFSTVDGVSRNRIARLHANGSLDVSFASTPDVVDIIHSLDVRADGKVMIAGVFTTLDGVPSSRLARLNADGTLDSTFDPGSGLDRLSVVRSVFPQADGKVLIGGDFTTVRGMNRNRIARLYADGSGDASFNPGSGADSEVLAVVAQPDGRVLIGGRFGSINGVDRFNAARLNSDGTLDANFVPPTGTNLYDSAYSTMALQPDGQVMLGGTFLDIFSGPDGEYFQPRSRYTRLDTNGAFSVFGEGGEGSSVSSIALQTDGRVLIGGVLPSSSSPSPGLFRLNSGGSVDASFYSGSEASLFVSAIAVLPDGKVIIGGNVFGFPNSGIFRLNSTGTVDSSFSVPVMAGVSGIYCIAVQPDGKLLVGGNFTTVNGASRNRVARLNADGTLDSSFNPGLGADGIVHSIALQADGNVLIGGEFTTVNGALRSRVARLYGDCNGPSNIAPSVAISSPPDGSSFVAPANVAIQINASDSDGFVARVEIRSGEAPIASTDSDPFEITWNGVPAGNYTLTAVATDNLGLGSTSIPVNITVATSPLPPAAPSGLTATTISRSKISLSWVDNSGDELGFKIERSTKRKPFKQIAITGPNVTTYTDTGLSAGQKYTYRVRAYNSLGDSAYLSPATAKTAKRVFTLFGL